MTRRATCSFSPALGGSLLAVLAALACSSSAEPPPEPPPSGGASTVAGAAGSSAGGGGGGTERGGSSSGSPAAGGPGVGGAPLGGAAGTAGSGGVSGAGAGALGGGGAGGAGGSPSTDCGLAPADPQASSRTRALLCYLKTHTNISGQTDMPDGDKVKEMTGRYPAIIAFDFYRYTDGDTSETQKAIDFFKNKKGIVAFQWHWKAPPGGEFYTDWDFPAALADTNSKLYRDVRVVVSELKKMGDAGVPVLFRPLHEANNNFMWWAKHGAANYKKLWKVIWDEAAKAGAHNLIWVFNGMASQQSTPMSDWYPGDDQADVIGSDYFQSQGDYDTMKNISPNKVLSIPETFNALEPGKDPPFSYFVVWASRDWGGKGAESSWKASMASPKTISIDQLPDMSRW